MSNVVPASVVDLSLADLEKTGLYEHFRTLGIHLRVAHQVIGARTVDAREARLLGRRKGDPVLTMERTSYDDQGRPVEYGLHLYRPDRYAYQTTLVDR
jgi:DNA-binding GntR family transcriptional regulator